MTTQIEYKEREGHIEPMHNYGLEAAYDGYATLNAYKLKIIDELRSLGHAFDDKPTDWDIACVLESIDEAFQNAKRSWNESLFDEGEDKSVTRFYHDLVNALPDMEGVA